MLKKMLVVSVATAGLACGAAFAGGSTAMPMAMSGPWGMTVDFGILYHNAYSTSNFLSEVPVTGSITYIDFADNFRVDAGIGYNLKHDVYIAGGKTNIRSKYGFEARYEMLHPWGSQTWFTYGLGAKVYGNGQTDGYTLASGGKADDSQVNFNVSANVGFMRALTNHSLVNFVVPVIGYTYAGETDVQSFKPGTAPSPVPVPAGYVKNKGYSSFKFFDGFTIGYTYLF